MNPSLPELRAPLFRRPITPAELDGLHQNTLVGLLGIEFTEVGTDSLRARMPVDRRTVQPAGILHGGASVVLAETLGSVAGWMSLDEGWNAVGLDINANHLRAVTEGWIHGHCRPIHIGRSTQVWQIDIRDASERMVCSSRITLAVVPAQKVPRPV